MTSHNCEIKWRSGKSLLLLESWSYCGSLRPTVKKKSWMQRRREQGCSGIHKTGWKSPVTASSLNVAVICRGIQWFFSLELHMHLVLDLEKLKEKLMGWGGWCVWGRATGLGKPFVNGKSEKQGQCELQPSPGALDQLQVVAAVSPVSLLSSCKSLCPVCLELYWEGCLVPLGRWHCVKPLWILFISS